MKSQAGIAKSLIKGCKEFNVISVDSPAPSGCSVYAMDTTQIFLLVKGMIDIPEEIEKLEKKKLKLVEFRDVIIKKQSADGYMLNVKDEVKQIDSNRVIISRGFINIELVERFECRD